MATFDLEQQEQLDQVKHFWKQYGNLITWTLVLVLGAYAAWTGYLYWQQKRAQGATGLYDELDKAASERNADRVRQAFGDLKAQYAGTTAAEQGALLDAKVPEEYAPLVADRRGDVFLAQGKHKEAIEAFQAAWKGLEPTVEYRRFVEGKLTVLGAPPEPLKAPTAPALPPAPAAR